MNKTKKHIYEYYFDREADKDAYSNENVSILVRSPKMTKKEQKAFLEKIYKDYPYTMEYYLHWIGVDTWILDEGELPNYDL